MDWGSRLALESPCEALDHDEHRYEWTSDGSLVQTHSGTGKWYGYSRCTSCSHEGVWLYCEAFYEAAQRINDTVGFQCLRCGDDGLQARYIFISWTEKT